MGARINIYHAWDGSSLRQLLAKNYVTFREWILEEYDSVWKDHGEELISQQGHDFLKTHTNYSGILPIEQALLDELVHVFVGTYCDHGHGVGLLEDNGYPNLKTWRYTSSIPFVEQWGDEEATRLFGYFDHETEGVLLVWQTLVYAKEIEAELIFDIE